MNWQECLYEKNNIKLYRDNELAVFENIRRPHKEEFPKR